MKSFTFSSLILIYSLSIHGSEERLSRTTKRFAQYLFAQRFSSTVQKFRNDNPEGKEHFIAAIYPNNDDSVTVGFTMIKNNQRLALQTTYSKEEINAVRIIFGNNPQLKIRRNFSFVTIPDPFNCNFKVIF